MATKMWDREKERKGNATAAASIYPHARLEAQRLGQLLELVDPALELLVL